jgi:hypothetical protein
VRDRAVLFLLLLATVARLAGPGGARSVVAESVLVKHQLTGSRLVTTRPRTAGRRAYDGLHLWLASRPTAEWAVPLAARGGALK